MLELPLFKTHSLVTRACRARPSKNTIENSWNANYFITVYMKYSSEIHKIQNKNKMADAKEREVEEQIVTTSRKVVNFIDTTPTAVLECRNIESCCEKTEDAQIQSLVNDISLPVANIDCSDCPNNSEALMNETKLSTCEQSQDLFVHTEGDRCEVSMEQMTEVQSNDSCVENLENTEASTETTDNLLRYGAMVTYCIRPIEIACNSREFNWTE